MAQHHTICEKKKDGVLVTLMPLAHKKLCLFMPLCGYLHCDLIMTSLPLNFIQLQFLCHLHKKRSRRTASRRQRESLGVSVLSV